MIALAFDTATSATVVGLQLPDDTVREARDDVDVGVRPRHTSRLLPLAAGLLDAAGLRWHDIELIAVGLGPGTFTGLRIGIATARGLAAATGAPLVGVGTLRALAAGGGRRRVLAVIDARRGEVFVAGYDDGRELIAPTAVAPGAVRGLATGPDWLAVGDGALRFRQLLEGGGLIVAPECSPLHLVSSAAILGLAAAGEVDGHEHDVLPIYVRLPDAELSLRAAAT